MKSTTLLTFSFIFIVACTQSCNQAKKENEEATTVVFNQELANEIIQMAEVDQTAAWIPEGKFKDYTSEQWNAYKDSVFTKNKKRAEEIFNQHGFPGFDLVGEKGAHDFWLIVQHCDFDPAFQSAVLKDMKAEIDKNNASKKNYAYLIDRVNKNIGKKIIYGTQVTYSEGQAISIPLEDPANVNKRRAEVGLEPLEEYLNVMTISHFEMNKEQMLKRGITEPKLYEVPEK